MALHENSNILIELDHHLWATTPKACGARRIFENPDSRKRRITPRVMFLPDRLFGFPM